MKAFLAAVVAMAALAIGADIALDRMGFSSSQVYSKPTVRLGE